MKLRPRSVLTKVQMVINRLFSQLETSKINFSQQQFSVEIKNQNLMILNWYSPYLQDIQWTIEFMGLKNLNQVSVSHHRRRRIRLLFYRSNALHFFQGQTKGEQKIRNKILQSQIIIPLNLPSNDQVLFISEDLLPSLNKGVFLIETVQKHRYVLRANISKQELIDLNNPNKISKIISSLAGLWSSMIYEQRNKHPIFSNLLIKSLTDQESFKTITLRNYELQIIFVNVPLNPGDKCKYETHLIAFENLEHKIKESLKIQSGLRISASSLCQLNDQQIGIFHLISTINDLPEFIIVLTLYDCQRRELKSIKHLNINDHGIIGVEFSIFNDANELKSLIVKKQFENRTILTKVSIKTLQILSQSQIHNFDSNSLLCSTNQNNHLLLLTPLKVFEVIQNQNQMVPQSSNLMTQEQNSYQQFIALNQISKLAQELKDNMAQDFEQKNFDQIFKNLGILSANVQSYLASKSKIEKNENQIQISELLRIETTVILYQSILTWINQINQIFQNSRLTFKDLELIESKNSFNQSIGVLMKLAIQAKQEFVMIWLEFFNSYKSKEFFKDEKLTKLQSQILKNQFAQSIDKYLEEALKIQTNQNLVLNLIIACSGTIQISRERYRNFLEITSNLKQVKEVALGMHNLDLVKILYFEKGQLSEAEVSSAFKYLKENKPSQFFQNCITDFIEEYIDRMKSKEKQINKRARNFFSVVSMFRQEIDLVKKICKNRNTDLDILFSLKLGQRQNLIERMNQICKGLKHQNKQVIVNFQIETPSDYSRLLRFIIQNNKALNKKQSPQKWKDSD